MSGQKNCPDKFVICPRCQCPCFFVFIIFCLSGPWMVVIWFPYFCPIVQQKHSTYFRNILHFLGILWALIITTCLKLLGKLSNIALKISPPKVFGRLSFVGKTKTIYDLMNYSTMKVFVEQPQLKRVSA